MPAFTLIIITLACFVTIMTTAIKQANLAIEKIQAEGGKIDLDSVTQAANQAISASDQMITSVAYIVLIICWLVGVIDSYRVGKQKDNATTAD